jgi:uncharacterized protein with PIN domain
MKFVVDCMLGKLAKWLKILGFDVAYLNKARDSDLLRIARRETRILLTRDHRLLEGAKDIQSLLIESEKWPEQVEQVLGKLNLEQKTRPFSRCLQCNIELKKLPKKRAKNLVAPFIFERAASLAICPSCGRIFWPGTHFEGMESKLKEILGKKKKAGARKNSDQPSEGRKNRPLKSSEHE